MRIKEKAYLLLCKSIFCLVTLACLLFIEESQAGEKKNFQIPRQRADVSLTAFARQANLTLIIPFDLVKSKTANALNGSYEIEQALEILLDGTGLRAKVGENNQLKIFLDEQAGNEEMKKVSQDWRGLFAGIASVFASATVTAQDSGGQAIIPGLEEIVVVATKREQSLQDVPVTISAYTADALAMSGIQGVNNIGEIIPGLSISQTSGATMLFLRGVGTNLAAAGQEPSVATYVDGIYSPVPRTGSLYAFNNIERVEVLKGPQGTLFGRNATGGVLHIITKDPSSEANGKIMIGYGNYDTFEANFYGSAGIGETLAADIALYRKEQGRSPLDNPLPNMDYLPEENNSWRSKVLFTPNDDLAVKIIGYYSDYQSSIGSVRQPVPGALAATGFGYSGDFHLIPNDFESYTELESKGASVQIDYALENMSLVSITSYAKDEAVTHFDGDGSIGFAQTSITPIYSDTLTQELRLVSNGDSDIEWITGIYLYENESGYKDPFLIRSPSLSVEGYSKQKVSAWAIFGETHWKLTENTGLTTGIRWSEDDLDMNGITFLNGNSPIGNYAQKDGFEKLTYRLGLDHSFSDDVMVYATYSRGYKTGVYNLINTGVPGKALEPEVLDALEIGIKLDGLLDARVRLNAAAFYYDYQDLQLTTVSTSSLQGANAAEAIIQGAEMELQMNVTDRLWIGMGVGYLDTEYDNYLGLTNRPRVDNEGNPTGGNIANISMDFSGNDLLRAPELTFTFSGRYFLPTQVGDFNFSFNYFWSDSFYWDQENRIKEPSYALLNAEASWLTPDQKIKLSLWGRNLMDEKYALFTNNSPPSGDAYGPAEPRMYGVKVAYEF